VTLRPGLQFHSGAPFGAEDVVATLRAFGSPKVRSRHAATVEPIASVTAEGDSTVRVRLKRPHASLIADFDLPILRRDQADAPPDPTGGSLDGLGPYEIEETSRGAIGLRPSPHGVMSEKPAKASVVLRTVHDENARALRLHSGRADVVMNGISPTLLPALDGQDGLRAVSAPGANLTYLVCRVDRGPLASRAWREEISMSIDRDGITRDLFSGRASPAETFLPEGHWARPHVTLAPPALRFTPELVKGRHEERPHLTLLTSTERVRVTIARTMAQELEDVGFAIEVVPLELGTLIARLNAGDFDMAILQLPELTEPNVLRVFLHSSYIPPSGANRGRIRDSEVDRLLDLGDSVAPDDRAAVYAKLEERLLSELFLIPLWHEDQVAVVSERARAFRPSPDGRWLGLTQIE
jgi:peptide/nickel transport system substrate-binding protein